MDVQPFDPFPEIEELPRTLANGWVRIKGKGLVHDPDLARLVVKLHMADQAVLRDCLEGTDPHPFRYLRGTP